MGPKQAFILTVLGCTMRPIDLIKIASPVYTFQVFAEQTRGATMFSDFEALLGKPMSTNHSSISALGNFDKLLVLVGTTSPILVNRTSEISSSPSPVRPRLESRMANAMTCSTEGLGLGNSQRFKSSQQSSSCSFRSLADMMPSFSAAKELDNI